MFIQIPSGPFIFPLPQNINLIYYAVSFLWCMYFFWIWYQSAMYIQINYPEHIGLIIQSWRLHTVLVFTQDLTFADIKFIIKSSQIIYFLKNKIIKTNCLNSNLLLTEASIAIYYWSMMTDLLYFQRHSQVYLWKITYFYFRKILIYIFTGGAIKSAENKQTCQHNVAL